MTDDRLEIAISNLLRAGVLLSLSIVMLGGGIYLFQHHAEPASYSNFQGVRPELTKVGSIWISAIRLQSDALIQLGMVLLIATPIARVIMAAFGFALERDRLYVVVSLLLIGILLYSILHAV